MKVFPSTEDCKIKNVVACNEKGCTKVFKSDSNLNLHLAKTHRKPELLQNNEVKQYHCPEVQCIYHKEKFLKNMKFLRQHYLKVHTKRDHTCINCQKSFTSEKSFQSHFPYCGVKFSCCDCTISYPSYETLQTHGRRKKHKILNKHEYTLKIVSSSNIFKPKKEEKFILPKPVNVIIISNSNLSKSVEHQCYETSRNKEINLELREENKEQSKQTQTNIKPALLSVGTQTDESGSCKIGLSNIKNQKTSDTQTDVEIVEDLIKSTAHTILVNGMSHTITNCSSTQTCADINLYNNTDKMPDSNLNNENNFEFDNCHMETQTDFIFDDVMFSSDYLMSNMYTQTCDDYLNQFSFNDIETQTVFDEDMIKSVESQTFMSPRLQSNYVSKDMSHTETQTDAEFRQILEVINS